MDSTILNGIFPQRQELFMLNQENANNLLASIISNINGINKEILIRHPLKLYIDEIEKDKNYHGYVIKSKKISNICEKIVERHGVDTLKLYHKAILLSLLLNNIDKIKDNCIIDDIMSIAHNNFANVFNTIIENKGNFLHADDNFRKNLAISSLRLIPLGAQKINISRIPYRMIYKGGIRQCLKLLYTILFTLKGLKPIYEIHTDSIDAGLLQEFNLEGWTRMYERAAVLLEKHKDVKGIIGTSWFFDPVLSSVSPHLKYLREIVTRNGGFLFYMGIDKGNDAILKSKSRKKLYDEGKYVPKKYAILWPRNRIIEWKINKHE